MGTTSQSSRFEFDIADERDDAELRALLRRTPVPGAITVTFEREPNFFAATKMQGDSLQVGVVRDAATRRIVGMGTRSVTKAFQNGVLAPLGYLSDLRLDPEHRKGTLVARGYKVFRELHQDGATQLYYTVIFSDNKTALRTIASGRAGLPYYYDFGLLHCPGINIGRRKPEIHFDGEIRRGNRELLPDIVECLNRNHRRRQFGPFHRVEDFSPGGRWREMGASDFYVAIRNNKIVGAVGKWNQRTFKQTRVTGYGGYWRWMKPLVNLASPWFGFSRLPQVGSSLKYFFASFVAVDEDNCDVFRALLRTLYNHAVGSEYAYFLIGLHERDPLLPILKEYWLTPFFGRLFCVCFADGEATLRGLDRRCPYVEVATL